MAKTRRKYKGNATPTTIAGGLSSGVSSCVIGSATGWPTSGPFYAVVDPGLSSEEKILVGSISGTTISSITRGVDDTTDQSHSAGCSIYPVFTATDADEANELTSTYANQGGIVYQGASTFAQLAIGTAAQVLKVNSGATAPEWGQVATAGITDLAVTTGKIADDAVTMAKLAPAATPGIIHISTTTISAETNKTISDVFTSTYSTYKIVISNLVSDQTLSNLRMRLSVSGSPDSDANYGYDINHSGYATGETAWVLSDFSSTGPSMVSMEVDNPQAAAQTRGVGTSANKTSSSYSTFGLGLVNTESTQYDGFYLFCANNAHKISAVVTVYGYTK